MANSTQEVVSDGTLVLLDISIEYLDRTEITVYFDSVLTTSWSWVGITDKQITFSPAVPIGTVVLVRRTTDITQIRHEFSLGAAFTAQSLDEDLNQVLHIAQEAKESNLSGDFYNEVRMHSNKITQLADGINPSDAVNLGQMQAQIGTPSAIAAHVALPDPHTQYVLDTELAAQVAILVAAIATKQASDAELTILSGLTTTQANAISALSGFIGTLLNDVDAATARATLGAGTVTGVTATAPITSSGGTAPDLAIPAATASLDGYMTSTYASKLDGIAAGATAGVPKDVGVGGIGYISFMRPYSTEVASGATVAGSSLNYCNASTGTLTSSGPVLAAGTWRNISPYAANGDFQLFQRIA